jgi:hypothetical protein
MKRIVLATALIGISLALSSPPPVEATTCDSVCNQIRRACRSSAKAVRQVGRADCDSTRDQCRTDCETNAATCIPTCDANLSACTAACAGDTICEADCASTHTQCLDDCANCLSNCNAGRVLCNDGVKEARTAANLICDGSRENCQEVCQDPIDRNCVRACKSDRRDCDGDAKRAEKTCRVQNCSGGTAQRACVRDCRRAKNAALGACADVEVLCHGACAGLDTP